MPQIDLVELKVAAGTGDLNEKLDSALSKCAPDDPPYLSDLLVNYNNGGLFVLQALEDLFNRGRNLPESQRFRWKLHAFRDKWGNTPQPGDIIYKKQQRPLNVAPDKLATARELDMDKRSGRYESRWIDKIPYIVDEKGCITCEFVDASYFLQAFGIHGKSGAPLSFHARESTKDFEKYEKRELSSRPVDAPDGNKLHVWYWRYKEVDKEDYEKLPKMKESSDPKRGNTK